METADESRLSSAYSSLKEKYVRMRDKSVLKDIKIRNLESREGVLLRRIESLQDELEKRNDSGIIKLPKKDSYGNYVTLKRFEKQKAETDLFIKLYHQEKSKNLSTISENEINNICRTKCIKNGISTIPKQDI